MSLYKPIFRSVTLLVFLLTATSSGQPDVRSVPITTEDQAVQIGLQFAGIDAEKRSMAAAASTAERITVRDSSAFWSSAPKDSMEVWEIRIGSYAISSHGLCGGNRSCIIWIAPETGAFLRGVLYNASGADSILNASSGDYYRSTLEAHNSEPGTPVDEPPAIDLREALLVPTISAPCEAKQVAIWCLNMSVQGEDQRPYWCVIGFGVPFLDLHGKHTSKDGKTPLVNYMSIIDATTGQPVSFLSVR
jgi:hypothetical protein